MTSNPHGSVPNQWSIAQPTTAPPAIVPVNSKASAPPLKNVVDRLVGTV
jgi:hypothetical protein